MLLVNAEKGSVMLELRGFGLGLRVLFHLGLLLMFVLGGVGRRFSIV